MPVNSQIDRVHPASTTALGGNQIYRGLEWQPTHRPEYHIFLYNISARTFNKVGPYCNITIPGVTDDDPYVKGMKANERYHYVSSFPQPMLMPDFNDQSSQIRSLQVDARRYVMDIVNPDNMTFSLRTVIPPEHVLSVNNDLSQKGVFFSIGMGDLAKVPRDANGNPLPDKQDVKDAYERIEKYYNGLLVKAQTLEMTDKAQLASELGGNPDYAYAATYFGKDFSWNKRQVRPVQCPNCGEMKTFGAKFHVNKELGFVCIEPTPEGWMAAYQAGVKHKSDVPEGMEWWKVEKQPKPEAQ
jgi:hypothetical protein